MSENRGDALDGVVPAMPAEAERYYVPEPGLSLYDYLRIIRERIWILGVTLFLAVALSVAYCVMAVPEYVAVAQLEILMNPPRPADIKGSVPEPATPQQFNQFFNSQLRILQSGAMVDLVLDDPEVQQEIERVRKNYPNIDRGFFERLFHLGPDLSTDAGRRARDRQLIRDSIRIRPVANSQLIDVYAQSADAVLAATIANSLLRNYVEQNLQNRMTRAHEGLSWLASMATNLEAQVAQREMALEDLKAEQKTISLEDRKDIVLQELRQLNSAVTQARTELIKKENTYNELSRLLAAGGGLDSIPAGIPGAATLERLRVQVNDREAALARLQERFLDKHPDVIEAKAELEKVRQQLRSEAEKLLQRARADYEMVRAREEELTRTLRETERKAMEIDRKRVEFDILQRRANTLEALYNAVLKRMEEAEIAGEMEVNNVQIVSEARPPARPTKPDRPRIILASTGFGLLSGLGLIFLLNAFDDRIKSQEDIEKVLSVPFLGLIPAVDNLPDEERDRLVEKHSQTTAAESFRTLRAALGFEEDDEAACRRIVITSAGPGEGKSLISSNLAIAYAQAGSRTLLVDADLRRPSLHRIFGVSRSGGLSDYLQGRKSAVTDVCQPTGIENLWLCTVGATVPNPGELLASQEMARFLAEVGESFDRVLLDTPPISAVADSLILSRRVDATMLIVQFGKVRKKLIVRTINRLIDARARIAGAVLNRINVNSGAYYYYYAYYHDSYYGDGERRKRRVRKRKKRRSSRETPASTTAAEADEKEVSAPS